MTSETCGKGVSFQLPGAEPCGLEHLLLDFNGTLALDGELLPGIAERLLTLSHLLAITVITSDTFGTVSRQLDTIPVRLQLACDGREKSEFIRSLKQVGTVAIGNGNNDIDMFRNASLSIAVLGPEGSSGALLREATIVVSDILVALDLLIHPKRLVATLRR